MKGWRIVVIVSDHAKVAVAVSLWVFKSIIRDHILGWNIEIHTSSLKSMVFILNCCHYYCRF